MSPELSLLLVAPYEGDGYESIERFVSSLTRELQSKLPVRVVRPKLVFGRLAPRASSIAKWCGYLDKFLVFPRHLHLACAGRDLVHFSDQSCAPFISRQNAIPQLLTCTDLIAIRSAAGEFPRQSVRWSGRQLQKLILQGINRSTRVACISHATRHDLLRLASVAEANVSVIPMGLHTRFEPIPIEKARAVLTRFAPSAPFVLHVGGNQWYKNRRGVLEIYRELLKNKPSAPNLLLVGKPLDTELSRFVSENGLTGKVFEIPACSDSDLAALYSAAEMLHFPSLHEGFGWPIIEAQACGCRVVTSDRDPMNQIGGSAAVYVDPENATAGTATLSRLLREPPKDRSRRVELGLQNAARYSTEQMIRSYLETYRWMSIGNLPQISPTLASV